jgi:hypothetical protein
VTGTSRAARPAPQYGATAAFPARAGADRGSWAGRGFTRPGPGAEVPRDLYRAALEDALAYTTDHDGCTDCDRGRLCEPHAARAARAQQYRQALDRELEAVA